jgi:serine/threonine-protein kinase
LNEGPVAVSDALAYIDQVLCALSYAHQQHIIHRDIKPANMMLTPEGVVKLMDFGIARTDQEPAKLTAPGTTLGSINYMSPEQVKGGPIDERSDLYSVGISLYEMVTGEKPFHGDSNFSIMAAHIQQAPTPPVQLHPGLPVGLNEIILTSIAKSPDDRFQSAEAFRNAIKSVLQSLQEAKTVVRSATAVTASGSVPAAYMQPLQQQTTPRTAAVTAASTAQGSRAVPAVPAPHLPPQPSATSHRGLYMALGGLLVVAVLIAAGIYLPSHKKDTVAAEGGGTPAPTVTKPVPSAPNPATDTSAPTPAPPVEEIKPVVTPPREVTPSPALAPPRKKVLSDNTGESSASASAAAAEKARAAEMAKQLDEEEHEIDQLTGRAGSISSSLDNLKRQQAASGFGLRGDMAEHESSMKLNLSKAQNAIEHNDLDRAKRYASMAETDIDALEKFLGR